MCNCERNETSGLNNVMHFMEMWGVSEVILDLATADHTLLLACVVEYGWSCL